MAAFSLDNASAQDRAKHAASLAALEYVSEGMRLGLGTGSTAAIFVDLLGERVKNGLNVICVTTSERTQAQAKALSIPLTTLDKMPELDLTIDGADEFDDQLRLIKGGGGALLREKIVASASERMVVIADSSKQVAQLGRFPLPIEIVPFGAVSTCEAISHVFVKAGCKGPINQRKDADGHDFVTDGGHLIVDCSLTIIPDPELLANLLTGIPGVVDHGLFIGLAHAIVVAGEDGVKILGKPA